MARELNDVVIVEAVRTPVGRARKGTLIKVRPDDLGALVVSELIKKVGIDPEIVEDLMIGCAGTEGEQGMNVARTVGLLSGLPVSIAAVTINRYCASSLCAIDQAAANIAFGSGDVIIAGGIESMSMVPTLQGGLHPEKVLNPALFERHKGKPPALTMIQTAQYISEAYNIPREEQDKFALLSHKRAIAAIDAGKFKDYTIPVPLKKKTDKEGNVFYEYVSMEKLDEKIRNKIYKILKEGLPNVDKQAPKLIDEDLYIFDTDEGPRRDTSYEKIASLEPVSPTIIGKTPVITAGNSSQINDAAGACLLMSEKKAKELGLKPLARLVSFAVAGVEPYEMGIGPSKAIPKALKRAGLTIDDMDLIEINEAFAVVVLTNIKLLKEQGMNMDINKINVNGGAISIGHPLGASGVRIVADLIHEMQRRNAKYAVASLCVGGGMGEAAVFEKL